jgi:hypothetical protein
MGPATIENQTNLTLLIPRPKVLISNLQQKDAHVFYCANNVNATSVPRASVYLMVALILDCFSGVTRITWNV